MRVLLFLVLLLTGFPTIATESGWSCRNDDMQVSCSFEGCWADESFTPMAVGGTVEGVASLCAYSGCWVGQARYLAAHPHHIWSVQGADWSTGDGPAGTFVLAIDASTGVGMILGEGFATPMRCEGTAGQGAEAIAKQEGEATEKAETETTALQEAEASGQAGSPPAGTVFRDCPECPEMVEIPAGSFMMGSSDRDPDEGPVRRVTIAQPFALAMTEVTQAQWRAVMGSDPSHFNQCGGDCPVEQVSWEDAQAYLRELSRRTGQSYRLPTESEWEYACRAGGSSTYCGGEDLNAVGWFGENSGRKTHSAGRKQANAFGLHDMSGNVFEWVEDCWNDSYVGAPSDGRAWLSGDCEKRVVRGGAWGFGPGSAHSANRKGNTTTFRINFFGFRPARMLP